MVNDEKGVSKFRLLGEIFVVLLAFTVFTIAFGLLFYRIQAGFGEEPIMPTTIEGRGMVALATFFTAPLSLFSTVLVVDFILRARGSDIFQIGLRKPDNWIKTVGLGVAMAVFATSLWYIISKLNINITGDEPSNYFDLIRGNGLLYFFSMTAIAWFSAGFAEEVIFRGFFMNNFLGIFGGGKIAIPIAIVLQAALFTGLHGADSLIDMLPGFMVGIVLGAGYFYCGRRLWPLVIGHGITISVYFTYLFFGTGV